MSDVLYRLTFSGEMLEGQHPAVVRKKLAALLKLEPERVEKLFSGDTVVIKKSVDEATAARFQAAFKLAGGRLRVTRIGGSAEAPAPVTASGAEDAQVTFELAEPGSSLLDQPKNIPDTNIDTSHLNIANTGEDILEEQYKHTLVEQAPDVSHISLSDSETFPPTKQDMLDALVIEPQDWQVGAVGEDMLEEYPDIVADIDLDAIDFDLAEPGSLMDQETRKVPPPAPDTSHISLED